MSYLSVKLASNPTAYYRMDETVGSIAHDLTGHGYDATLSGGFTLNQGSLIGSDVADPSTSFNGLTGTITLPFSLNISSCTSLSIDFWIKTSGTSQYIALTCNNTSITTYLNGVVYSSSSGDFIGVGSLLDVIGSYLSGNIDDLSIYKNVILSPTQISSFYSAAQASTIVGLQVTLSGVDITSTIDEYSIKVTDTLGQGAGVGGGSAGRAATGEFLTTLGPAATALGAGTHITTPTLVREGEIIFKDATGTNIFGGFVGKITDKTDKKQVYTLVDCYDYYQQLDRYQVQKVYTGVSDVFMIKDLLKSYAPWVDQSLLPSLGSYVFTVRNFKATTLQKTIAAITDVTGYQFWIDANKRARYVTPLQSQTAPFGISTSPDSVSTFPSKVTEYITDDNAAINRVTFYGGKRPSNNFTQDLSTQANGTNKLFVLAYYPRNDAQGSIAVSASNIRGGVNLTVGYLLGSGTQNQLKSAGGLADVLLNADAHTLTFDIAPINSGALSVSATYRYEYPMVIQLTDQSSFQFYGAYYDGVISDDTIFDSATAVGRCRTLLTEQSRGLTTLKAQCWKAGLQAGQILRVVDAVRGINNSYIIQQVDTVPLGAGNFRYELQLGAWNWNLIDAFMNSIHAAEAANLPNSSDQNGETVSVVQVSQMFDSVGVHAVGSRIVLNATGGPFYAHATPTGTRDAFPGFCTST